MSVRLSRRGLSWWATLKFSGQARSIKLQFYFEPIPKHLLRINSRAAKTFMSYFSETTETRLGGLFFTTLSWNWSWQVRRYYLLELCIITITWIRIMAVPRTITVRCHSNKSVSLPSASARSTCRWFICCRREQHEYGTEYLSKGRR